MTNCNESFIWFGIYRENLFFVFEYLILSLNSQQSLPILDNSRLLLLSSTSLSAPNQMLYSSVSITEREILFDSASYHDNWLGLYCKWMMMIHFAGGGVEEEDELVGRRM